MADSGSNRSIDNKSPFKVVRAQKIIPSAPSRERLIAPDDSEDDDDESADHAPAPLPRRSHTPGHLASKSSAAANEHRRRATAALNNATSGAARHRSQSASYAQSSSIRPSQTARQTSALTRGPTPTDEREDTVGDRLASYGRKPVQRTVSAIASQQSSVVGPIRSVSGEFHPEYTRFPALQDPKLAVDVPQAPSSGMYWSRALVSGTPSPPLRAHTTTLIGSNVYVFGGCDAKACFNDLYVLDADAFYWSHPYVVGEVPVPLRAMTCTAVGKKLVVFGGGDGPAYFNDIHVLDTANFRWSRPRVLGDHVPSKRRAHTACLYKNGLYIFGGGDGVRALNDIWRLDVSDVNKMSWRLVSGPEKGGSQGQRPKARGYHTANMVGSKLIIYGGSDGGECFDDVWVYDVEENFWKAVTIPITFRRLSHTATIVGPYLFVIGGHDGNEYSNELLLLNLVTMTWDKRKTYGKPPTGRGYHGVVLYDSRLIVIGGFDGSEVFRDVMLLELAVHAYYSQISHFSIEV